MNNLFLLIIELIICFITIIAVYKYQKDNGIYYYVIISFIIASIMSLKTITVFNFDTNLGVVPFVSIFTAANILIQKKGPEIQKNLIISLLAVSTVAYILFFIVSIMKASEINLFTSASYNNLFKSNQRLFFANLVTILYSLLINSKLYYSLKKMKNNILISGIFSSIIIEFIASILFSIVAYTFVLSAVDVIKNIMIRYLISLIVGLLGTTCIYISKYIK